VNSIELRRSVQRPAAQQFGVSDREKPVRRDKEVVDIIGLSGWYSMVSMALNVDRYPVAQAELKPLANPLQ
jgi:hypothetical protein